MSVSKTDKRVVLQENGISMDEKVYQCIIKQGVGYREKPSFDSKVHDWLLRTCADGLDVSNCGGRVRTSEVPGHHRLLLQMHYVKVHSSSLTG